MTGLPTSKEIFRDGILKFDFQVVLQVLGEDRAVEWGERCMYDSDVTASNGQCYRLSGFRFQFTYTAWKEQNKDKAGEAIKRIIERDRLRRADATAKWKPPTKKKKTVVEDAQELQIS
jgi:hypothetical protein